MFEREKNHDTLANFGFGEREHLDQILRPSGYHKCA